MSIGGARVRGRPFQIRSDHMMQVCLRSAVVSLALLAVVPSAMAAAPKDLDNPFREVNAIILRFQAQAEEAANTADRLKTAAAEAATKAAEAEAARQKAANEAEKKATLAELVEHSEAAKSAIIQAKVKLSEECLARNRLTVADADAELARQK